MYGFKNTFNKIKKLSFHKNLEWKDVERFTDNIKLEIGYCKTVSGTILLACYCVDKLGTVSYQISYLSDVGRRNK